MVIVPNPFTEASDDPDDEEDDELCAGDSAKVIMLIDKPRIAIRAATERRAAVWRLDIRGGRGR